MDHLQSVTVGTVATFLAQWLKNQSWFPEKYRTTFIRLLVASVCLLINAGTSLLSHGSLTPETLLNAFLSYAISAAEYDHLFKA